MLCSNLSCCIRYAQTLCRLENLWRGRWGELCAKDLVPEPAGNTESVLVVHEVVLKVVLLQLTVVRREAVRWLAVELVMGDEILEAYFLWCRK